MNCPIADKAQAQLSEEILREIHSFLKENAPYYLATVDEYQARVRPMGTSNVFENRLYFQTGRSKGVYRQLKSRPRVEIAAFDGERWLRITGFAHEDDSTEAAESLLESYPHLRERYAPGDGNMAMFYLDISAAYLEDASSGLQTVLVS